MEDHRSAAIGDEPASQPGIGVGDRERQAHALLAVAAHELRHPLHLMRLAVARYLPQPGDPAREALERYIARMSRVISDLLDAARFEQNALVLQLAPVDITQVLRETVDGYRPDAAARKITLTLDGAASPAWIKADEQRLVQVLSNLIENALKFTPADGCIQVTLERAGGQVQVRVRDTGDGIAPDALPHVFDLFATAAQRRGLGIGLAVARQIVERHHGSIDIFSDGINRGTEVVVALPEAVNDVATCPG